MNKKITAVALTALMVLTMFTAMVPLASAAKEVTAPYEFIAATNATNGVNISVTSETAPSVLYYDMDDAQGAEALEFPTYINLTIPEGELIYTIGQWFDKDSGELYTSWGGNKYIVSENSSSKWIINEKLVDEDEDDDHLLRVGESLSLPNGWGITAMEIDVEGEEAWLSLTLDGEEVDNEVVSTKVASKAHFLYEEDILTANDVDVMNFTVETVFAGMNTNLVKINNIDLLDLTPVEIKSSDDDLIPDYDIKMTKFEITIENEDDVGLSEDDTTDIFNGMFQIRVNEDGNLVALAKTITEPGTYELIGATNATNGVNISVTSETVPSILYYDMDDAQGAEALEFPTYINLTIPEGELIYTIGQWFDKDSGDLYTSWGGNKYIVSENSSSKWIINEKLVDEDEDDDHLLRVGESLSLPNGWGITVMEIDVEGEEAWLSLTLDGEEVDNEVVSTKDASKAHFLYEEDILTADDVDVMNFTVETVFAGMNTNLVKINNIDLLDLTPVEIKSSDDDLIPDYDIKMTKFEITIENEDDVGLSEDDITDIFDGMFQIRVNEDGNLVALVQTIIIGGGATQTTTPIVTATATTNATAIVTGDGTPTGTDAPPVETTPTPEPTETDVPGFEGVFAVAGLLAVAYLVLRQRE